MDLIQFDGEGYKVEILKGAPKKEFKENIIIVQGGDDTINRLAVSCKFVDILLDPHLGDRRDKIYQRNSGLNQVLCELARENNVGIGFSFISVLNSRKRWELLGRIIQNIMLCRKYKVRMVIGSFAKNIDEQRNEKDLQSFFKVLGMTGKDVQMNFVNERFDYKRKYIMKGVMLE